MGFFYDIVIASVPRYLANIPASTLAHSGDTVIRGPSHPIPTRHPTSTLQNGSVSFHVGRYVGNHTTIAAFILLTTVYAAYN